MINDNRLQHTVNHLFESWIPFNVSSVERVRTALHETPAHERAALVAREIRNDIGLFAHLTIELKRLLRSRSGCTGHESLEEMVEQVPAHEIAACLPAAGKRTVHQLSRSTPEQLDTLGHLVVSARASELVSAHYEVSEDLAFTAQVFKQLGMVLVAWNYPHLYERVVKETFRISGQSAPNLEIERRLTRILGYPPSILAIHIARSALLPDEVRYAIGDRAMMDDSPKIAEASSTLKKVTEIGEVFARTTNPVRYPEAQKQWQAIREELLPIIGTNGLRELTDECTKALNYYGQLLPQKGALAEGTPPKRATPGPSQAERYLANVYLPHCPPVVQEQARALYAKQDADRVSRDTIDQITRSLIPAAGFSEGCIYLIDPTSLHLVPRILVGESKLVDYSEVVVRNAALSDDPVSSAYRFRTPVRYDLERDGTERTAIAGALGNGQRIGVVLLISSADMMKRSGVNPMIRFKALRQLLVDCLNIY